MNKELLTHTEFNGAKGPVFFGKDKLLVYKRDYKTDYFPGYLDFPGGGQDKGETVFDTFKRELKEEFDLNITPEQVVYVKQYQSTRFPDELAYFVVAELPVKDTDRIRFGSEGVSYQVMSLDDFLASPKAIPFLKERVKEYLAKGETKDG